MAFVKKGSPGLIESPRLILRSRRAESHIDYAFTERNHNDDTNSSLQNMTQDPGLFFKALQKRFCDNHG